jgi:type IV secretion system protein VirD4
MQKIRLMMMALSVAWTYLPIFAALFGYLIFADQPYQGIAMAFVLTCVGILIKQVGHNALKLVWPRATSHGSARFATSEEISQAKLLRRQGLILGRYRGRMLRYSGEGHLLTFAPTRSGKGVGCVIPNLLSWPGSVVVTDIKGENHAITATYRATLGEVHTLAPFANAAQSSGYNPLDFIRIGSAYELDDARLIAEMLVVPERTEPNHWEREARTLIIGLLLYICHHYPVLSRHIKELRELVMEDAEGFDIILSTMMVSEHQVVARTARGFSQKEPKERSAVISTAQAVTAVFDSPRLCAITEQSSFKLEDLKERTLSIYIIIPPEQLEAYRPYLRLMTGLCTAAMTRDARKPKTTVLFLLDELPALGYMRPIEDGIGYLAGYGAKLWLFIQDLDQLERIYPKARSMIANCAVRQAFNVQDPATARLLSDMLGTATVRVASHGRTSPLPVRLLSHVFHSSSFEAARQLMTPDEILSQKRETQLLFVEGLRGFAAHKIRYFELCEFRLNSRSNKQKL